MEPLHSTGMNLGDLINTRGIVRLETQDKTDALEEMIEVLSRLRSSVVIPMHWFGVSSLERFLDGIAEEGTFLVDRSGGHDLEISLRTLPSRPTVKVLMPRYLSDQR